MRLQVLVAQRPILTVTIKRSGLQIQVAVTRYASPPDQSFPANYLSSNPVIGLVVGGDVRMKPVIYENMPGIFIRRVGKRVLLARGKPPTVLALVRPLVRHKVFG